MRRIENLAAGLVLAPLLALAACDGPVAVAPERAAVPPMSVPSVSDPSPSEPSAPEASGTAPNMSEPVGSEPIGTVVSIEARGCGRTLAGTGVVVARGTVLTAAHVVDGMVDVDISGPATTITAKDADIVVDNQADLALVRNLQLDAPAVALGNAVVGTTGLIVEGPGQDTPTHPFTVTSTGEASVPASDGSGRVVRPVMIVSATVERGDSGAPLFDESGAVVGVIFGIEPDVDGVAYATPAGAILEFLTTAAKADPVATPEC